MMPIFARADGGTKAGVMLAVTFVLLVSTVFADNSTGGILISFMGLTKWSEIECNASNMNKERSHHYNRCETLSLVIGSEPIGLDCRYRWRFESRRDARAPSSERKPTH